MISQVARPIRASPSHHHDNIKHEACRHSPSKRRRHRPTKPQRERHPRLRRPRGSAVYPGGGRSSPGAPGEELEPQEGPRARGRPSRSRRTLRRRCTRRRRRWRSSRGASSGRDWRRPPRRAAAVVEPREAQSHQPARAASGAGGDDDDGDESETSSISFASAGWRRSRDSRAGWGRHATASRDSGAGHDQVVPWRGRQGPRRSHCRYKQGQVEVPRRGKRVSVREGENRAGKRRGAGPSDKSTSTCAEAGATWEYEGNDGQPSQDQDRDHQDQGHKRQGWRGEVMGR